MQKSKVTKLPFALQHLQDDPRTDTVHHPYTAYSQGYTASKLGFCKSQCPYAYGRERRWWMNGFDDERNEE